MANDLFAPQLKRRYQPEDPPEDIFSPKVGEALSTATGLSDLQQPTANGAFNPRADAQDTIDNKILDLIRNYSTFQPKQVGLGKKILGGILPSVGQRFSGQAQHEQDLGEAGALAKLGGMIGSNQKTESDIQHDRSLEEHNRYLEQVTPLKNNPTDKFLYHELDENQEDHAVFQGTNGQMYTVKVPGFKGAEKAVAGAQQIAGRDIPLPDAVVKQRIDLAKSTRAPSQSGSATADNRLDRSYQYNNGQIVAQRKAVDDRADRMTRLEDTINQQTPQADALIAPELITVMAGGMGSGVRINQSEIDQVIGGRSKVESLKAALNKWQLDPTKSLSVTPEQRKEMRALIGLVAGKVRRKQEIYDEAQDSLINTPEVEGHRKVLSDMRNKLQQVDSGNAAQAQTGGPPPGATMRVPGSDGKLHWSDGKRDLGVIQ